MAYASGDFLVEIKGTTVGDEIWSNTWCVSGAVSDIDKDNAVTALHQFYEAIKPFLHSTWTGQVATGRDLFLGTSADYPWADQVGGESTAGPLPSQLAIRASLSTHTGQRGGPFLTGWATDIVDSAALVQAATATLIADEVEDLAEQLVLDGMALAIHLPTTSSVALADIVRVGQRFDIIRKRANAILEAYTARDLT